jgi:hypothetical protein
MHFTAGSWQLYHGLNLLVQEKTPIKKHKIPIQLNEYFKFARFTPVGKSLH